MKYDDKNHFSDNEDFDSAFNEEKEEVEYSPPRARKIILTFTAFIILVAFVVWSFPQLGIFFSDMSFLAQNQQLKEEAIVQNSLPAIVSVESKGEGNVNKNGTGFNIAPKGLILTNYHVVEGAVSINIVFPDGKSFYSNDFKQIANADIVVISLNSSDLPYLPMELQEISSEELLFTIIGNPLGYKQVAVQGNIGSYYNYNDYFIFEINAPVKKGSSGSPVINTEGSAVGIVFAHRDIENNGATEYHALAIPLNQFAGELDAL
ncbi:MAG TPA: serine protease [Syntrophomonadaceae bacterium]|nr:serine protease [Syntrophomonadaceae bacterium]HNX28702.1 serine protease [Syntrophomonadaceae bacterium]HPR94477.1 serine protease [Syntrophomonadaceae bacterium]